MTVSYFRKLLKTMSYKRRKQYCLPGHSYARPDGYFITVCTNRRGEILGEVLEKDGRAMMVLSEIGTVLDHAVRALHETYKNLWLGLWQIMPGHVHLIIDLIGKEVVTKSNIPEPVPESTPQRVSTPEQNLRPLIPGSVSSAINHMKGAVTKWARNNNIDFGWQPRFHDRVIRNKEERIKIENYILRNPERWLLKRRQPLS